MGFSRLSDQGSAVALLRRSLGEGRLGHAYLFVGEHLGMLSEAAKVLAKTLNCLQPPSRAANGVALDSCDECLSCRKIDGEVHADVHWLRPESKTRVVTVDQMRELLQVLHLKPTEGTHKVAVLAAADRLNPAAANAFLKTLEEPPSRSVLLLLTTDPGNVLETVVSRCLRLNFGGLSGAAVEPGGQGWLTDFVTGSVGHEEGLLGRYRLLGVLLAELGRVREQLAEELGARSPLAKYGEAAVDLKERWETELAAAIEAEYRRVRGEKLALLQRWLRDVWLVAVGIAGVEAGCPALAEASRAVGERISAEAAAANLGLIERTQRLLRTNVQEALAIEVGLLGLRL
jgi:DNA polymerase-3 subunit delta'